MPPANSFHSQERPIVMPNNNISQRQPYFERAPSRRRSIDFGNQMTNVPPSFGTGDGVAKAGVSLSAETFGSFKRDALLAGDSSSHNYGDKKGLKSNCGFDDFSVSKKRRCSGAGFVFPSSELPLQQFEDGTRHQRRLSVASIVSDRFPDGELDDLEGEDLLRTFDTSALGPNHTLQFYLPPQPSPFMRPSAFFRRPVSVPRGC